MLSDLLRKYIEKTGISRGFLFFTNESEEATDHFPHISHLIEVDSDIDDGTKTHIVAPLDGIVQLDLPFPSPELREERFAYYFPDSATTIDELNFTARRDDQVPQKAPPASSFFSRRFHHVPHLLYCQPKRRRWQNHHDRQSRRRAGPHRAARAAGGYGPSRQCHDGIGRGQAQPAA